MCKTLVSNPFERFTKNNIKEKGYKLAFFDACALNDLINPNNSIFNNGTREAIKLYKEEGIKHSASPHYLML